MNGIGQQAKGHDRSNKHIYKVPDTGFKKYMYVDYVICKTFNKAYKL